jgi:dimethylhistidine N-methyltransferase
MPQAVVSPAFFYDALGSHLFNAITLLDEYRATRDERDIFALYQDDIAAQLPADCTFIDLGAGDCCKAASLFASIRPKTYLAADVSEAYLREALKVVSRRPDAPVLSGLVVNFAKGLPAGCLETLIPSESPRVFFYPGSSIGNFHPQQAAEFLQGLARDHEAAALVIGIDLVKPVPDMEAAYDDALGVTAAFNLNLLRVLNRSVETDFNPRDWSHKALFDAQASRIEMHLVARHDVTVTWPSGRRVFQAGETLHTENSYKYTETAFADLLRKAGYRVVAAYRSASAGFAEFVAVPDASA